MVRIIKDLYNQLPRAIVEMIDSGDCADLQSGELNLMFSSSEQIYDTGLSALTINNYLRLIRDLVKYIPEDWVDRLISFDRIRYMSNFNYWISNNDFFSNIQKYTSKEEFSWLISVMITEFNLKDPNLVYHSLLNKEESLFCELLSKYDKNKKYLNFVAKCSGLLLLRRFMYLELSNPNILNEIAEIKQVLFCIKRNTEKDSIIDVLDLLGNDKVDRQEKINFLRNDFFCGADLIDKLNFKELEEELACHLRIQDKLNVVVDSIETIIADNNDESQVLHPSGFFSIERCSLGPAQLEMLFDSLFEAGYLDEQTNKDLFVRLFSGQNVKNGERVFFRFKNQYSFKFLLQEIYRNGFIEKKEVPPQGIEVGKSSKIFFFNKGNTLRPLKFQKTSDSEESDNAKREKRRIKELVDVIRAK